MGITFDEDGTVNISGMVVDGGVTVTGDGVVIGPTRPRRVPRGTDVDAIQRRIEDDVRNAGHVVENSGVMNVGSGTIVITDSVVGGERVTGQTIHGYVQG